MHARDQSPWLIPRLFISPCRPERLYRCIPWDAFFSCHSSSCTGVRPEAEQRKLLAYADSWPSRSGVRLRRWLSPLLPYRDVSTCRTARDRRGFARSGRCKEGRWRTTSSVRPAAVRGMTVKELSAGARICQLVPRGTRDDVRALAGEEWGMTTGPLRCSDAAAGTA